MSARSKAGTLDIAPDSDVAFAEKLFAGYSSRPDYCCEHLSIKIGNITMRVTMPAEGFARDLGKRYDPFSWEGQCDYDIDVVRVDGLDLTRYRNIIVRSLPEQDIHYAFRGDFVARLQPSAKRATILMAPVASASCVDTIMRMTASFAALANGGLLLHSAAIATPLGGFVFCGVSRSGKSTIAKLSSGPENVNREILTDEMSLVERDGEGYRLGGTPFWGELGLSVNRRHPLKGILILAKAPANSIEHVRPGEAARELMKTILCFAQEQQAGAQLLDTVLALLSKVPVRRLNFLPNASLWETVEDHFG